MRGGIRPLRYQCDPNPLADQHMGFFTEIPDPVVDALVGSSKLTKEGVIYERLCARYRESYRQE